MITERENALRMLRRTGDAEWVPVVSECYDNLIPSVVFERPKIGHDGEDWFGCYWIFDPETIGFVQDPKRPVPCSDITKWKEQVVFPDLDSYDWAASAEQDLQKVDKENKLLRMFLESGPWERLHALIGFEEAFVAMYDEPEAFKELMQALVEHRIRLMRKLKEYYEPDVIFSMEDLGSRNASLMSPEMYREFIKPFQKQMIDECHRLGMYYEAHSCGKMDNLAGDLVEIGADILNPIQNFNDQEFLAREYGGKVTFDGGYDISVHYPETTEEELRAEVRRAFDIFAPTRSYFYTNNSVIRKNQAIMTDEAKKYGFHYWDRENA